MKIQTV